MNTSEVAKLLGVSSSTIQRWVKQLQLPMERNERGHYFFSDEDIELLKGIQQQIQNGTILQDIAPTHKNKIRKGAVKTTETDPELEKLSRKVTELEASLHAKADSVTSYQLLQHRREIEELQAQLKDVTKQLKEMQNHLEELKPLQPESPLLFDQNKGKRKKKNLVRTLFGF